MARRTRRNLADKRIRKILQEKLQSGQKSSSPSPSPLKKRPLKPAVYFLGILLVLVVGYYGYSRLNLSARRSSQAAPTPAQSTSAVPSQNQPPASSVPDQSGSPVPPPAQKPPETKPVQGKPQVEVLNGCGVDGIARTTMKFLREHGFDVVYMGNYSNFNVKQSQVLSRSGNMNMARKIAETLGISAQFAKKKVDKNKQLEASIVLGSDYKKLKPFKK